MSRPPHPNAADHAADDFELAWLRRTDALADPMIRARSLCGEISQLVAADRVSYLTTHDCRSQLIATSTTPTIDPRATETAWLRQLADEVCRTGTDFLTDRTSTDRATTLADATETLAIPVMTSESVDSVAAVIVLQRSTQDPQSLSTAMTAIRPEIDAAATEVATALRSRAMMVERRGATWWRQAPNWQRLGMITAICIGTIALLNVPTSFRLPVEGRLEPARSLGVFAPATGTLVQLHVEDDESVAAGTVLAELNNVDIELQQERLTGELATAETELATLRLRQSDIAASDSANQSPAMRSPEAGSGRARQMVLRARIESLQEQTDLVNEVVRSLTIRAPIDGRVVLRDEQADFVGQSISQSQWLLQIVDPADGYQTIIDLPENDDAYLRHALNIDATAVVGSLRLLASPDVHFSGKVTHVTDTVQLNERGNASIEVTIPVNDRLPDDVHVGATVVGTIDVGKRALGYVWFRPIIEFLRSYGW